MTSQRVLLLWHLLLPCLIDVLLHTCHGHGRSLGLLIVLGWAAPWTLMLQAPV